MDALLAACGRRDLDPVTLLILASMLLLRLRVARSLRWRRAYERTRGEPPVPSQRSRALEWLDAGILAAALLLFVVRPFIVQIVPLQSAAMYPTLHGSPTPQIDGPNDRLLVNKYLYRFRPPHRGEIVFYRETDDLEARPGDDVVKRVVGLPGDRVEINQFGGLVVNSRVVDEPYVREPADNVLPAMTVPAGVYFMLGDNRNHGAGSKAWVSASFLPAEHLRGKAMAVAWPLDRLRLLP